MRKPSTCWPKGLSRKTIDVGCKCLHDGEDVRVASPICFPRWSNADFDYLSQIVQELKQPVRGKPGELTPPQCGDLGLIYLQKLRCLFLSQSTCGDSLTNLVL